MSSAKNDSNKPSPLTGAERQQRYRQRQQRAELKRLELILPEASIEQLDALCKLSGVDRNTLVKAWVGQATRQVQKRTKKLERGELSPEKSKSPKERKEKSGRKSGKKGE
jgi:hypothetical protein